MVSGHGAHQRQQRRADQPRMEQSSEELSRRVVATFLAGVIVGAIVASVLAGGDDCGGAVYSPVRYYGMLSQV